MNLDSQIIVAQRVAKIVRACRKNLGISQTCLARELGIDQSALSRVESCRQNLTAQQWFYFCKIVQIAPDSLSFGLVEILGKSDISENSQIFLPERYSFNAFSKVRGLQPLINVYINNFGESNFEEWVQDLGIDPDFFVNLENKINFYFYRDLAKTLLEKKALNKHLLPAVRHFAQRGELHGSIKSHFDFMRKHGIIQLCETWIANSDRYSENFAFELHNISQRKFVVSMTPRSHMQEFKFTDDQVLKDFPCQYLQVWLEGFLSQNENDVQVKVIENMFKDKSLQRCAFSVQN